MKQRFSTLFVCELRFTLIEITEIKYDINQWFLVVVKRVADFSRIFLKQRFLTFFCSMDH